jgi:hypothetical protein
VINDSFGGMVGAVAGDVHPPLYYIILKSVFSLFEAFKIPFDEIIIGKLVSLIPLILLQLFSFFKLRKDYGWLSAGIFSMAIITMPAMMYYGIEIRMYSWAMFFVTMSFYYAYKITKEPDNKINWGLITLFAVLSAYTHYFAAISCFVIFTLLLIWIIVKNKAIIKYWLISVISAILLYLPWINILTNQFTDKGGTLSFIPPITVGHVLNQLKFIMVPGQENAFSIALGLALLIIIIFLLAYVLIKKEDNFLYLGILVFFGTSFIVVVESLIYKPSLISRYLVPTLGCFWLGFAILLNKFKNKKEIFYPTLIIFLFIGGINAESFITSEQENERLHNEFMDFSTKNIKPNDLIIHFSNFFGLYGTMSYFLENNAHIYNDELKRYNENNILVKKKVNTMEKIEEYINNNKSVWFFYDEDKRAFGLDEFNETLAENGFKMQKVLDLDLTKTSWEMPGDYPDAVYKIHR